MACAGATWIGSADRITVHSPKTEHHEGGARDRCPSSPRYGRTWRKFGRRPNREREFVITRYRSCNANLRTQLERIIRKAGLKPWPKLFQNLRSSRETELAQRFPMHVICSWIGNSQAVAMKHYLQTTDEHYRQALEAPISAAQNPAQQRSESARKGSQPETRYPGFAGVCVGLPLVATPQIGPVGIEPTTKGL